MSSPPKTNPSLLRSLVSISLFIFLSGVVAYLSLQLAIALWQKFLAPFIALG
ncbi:hypothetical protein PMG71_13725 [Roseofilum sp. BLCC_M154]|uniref:AI-2E family transporter n=1 Tax=Roseofilum acuticapitatum BLCC-M154 TaxID=3022444 RepID=A0ABT7AUB5_9CYAN|nr:hypothetical protein [Roseofilum acuticapitatum]MDJ1170489.1 hypothetical protein [Roseofilum acuticapitatum BLCC-M154]